MTEKLVSIVQKIQSKTFISGNVFQLHLRDVTMAPNSYLTLSFNRHHRVTLKTLNSFVKVPKFNDAELTESDDLDEVESETFGWQQKQFNSHELSYFQMVDNCKTDAQKRYNQQILADEHNENGSRSRIFSYVMDDKFAPPVDESNESRDYQLVQNVDNYGDWTELLSNGESLTIK